MSNQELWVVAQTRGEGLAPVTYEALEAASSLAEGGGQVALFVASPNASELAKEGFAHGARKVYAAPVAASGADDQLAEILAAAVAKHHPRVVIGAATTSGKALFPRLAALCGGGFVPDVTRFAVEAGAIHAYRPCFGGNVIRRVQVRSDRLALFTVRPKVFPQAARRPAAGGDLVMVKTDYGSRIRVRESVSEKAQTVNLNEADAVVAGGRGLRAAENFKLVFDLAQAVGGAVGASRAVVDAGWIPYAHQVGQTGKTVNPKLYIAIGISGAIQHLVGMQSSGVIVAVNKDPDAPIFKVATFGIVGDLFEIAPALARTFAARLGN